ncbi:MAG: zinc-ribbon domain-containing protein [Bacilli bacterium]|nr:zinc-ribbon domain-containing protein [Bacilli bacterium]
MAKFCTNCGNELDDRAIMCPKCGIALTQTVANSGQTQSNGMAIAGFILSFFIPLLGLIFSIIGLKRSKETNNGKGLSTAGIIISCITMVITLIIGIISFSAVSDTIDKAQQQTEYNRYYYDY